MTAISGTFTDMDLGIANAAVTGIVPLNRASPASTNLLAPNDFSHFAVASGLPAENNGQLSYDDLFYPNGQSPQSATDYPFHGGFFDIYGVLFSLANGDQVNLWSNGIEPGEAALDYGVAVVTSASTLDYVSAVEPTPEPGSLVLVLTGAAGVTALWRQRRLTA